MEEFVRIALTFPTAIFSVLLPLVVVYWLFVFIGIFDLELFEIDLDLDLEVDLGAAADGAADGALEGAADALGGAGGVLTHLLAALSLGTVPVTILFSFFILTGWLTSFAGLYYLEAALGGPLGWGLRAGVLAVATLAGMIVTSLAARPLRPVFATETRRGQETLIGQTVRVSTGRVDANFGQATLEDGGAGLVLSIRCEGPNTLTRGDEALIIGYDPRTHLYYVEPYETLLGSSHSDVLLDLNDTPPKAAPAQHAVAAQASGGEDDELR